VLVSDTPNLPLMSFAAATSGATGGNRNDDRIHFRYGQVMSHKIPDKRILSRPHNQPE
jgi:hypothetical protein